MLWKTIAEGTSIGNLKAMVGDMELPKGTPVRFEMTLKLPLAHAFDLAGAELLFRPVMPEGLDLKDVYSPDDTYQVVVEAESDPVWIVAIIAFVKAHWLLVSLVGIGLVFTLGFLVGKISVKAPVTAGISTWAIVAVIAGIALVGYLAYRGYIPKLALGKG